ncbi:MAG: hypothetical protein IKR81_06155, partial [Victivallales bacterium]|nr:hypothetical protein [Victivallales bacterium]
MKSRFAKAALIGVLSATAAFGASETLYDYFKTSVEASAGFLPNKLSLSIYEEVKFEDNQDNSPRRDREENLAVKTGVNASLTRTKGWVTYGADADASYEFWRRDADDKNGFDWSISPMLMLSVDSENSNLQNLKISFSSKSKYEKLSKTDRREARHIDNKLGIAYDFMAKGRFGNVITFDYEYDYYTKNKY